MINKTELAFYADPKKDGIIENSEIDKATATVADLLEMSRASADTRLIDNIDALSQKLTEKKTNGGSLKYFRRRPHDKRFFDFPVVEGEWQRRVYQPHWREYPQQIGRTFNGIG